MPVFFFFFSSRQYLIQRSALGVSPINETTTHDESVHYDSQGPAEPIEIDRRRIYTNHKNTIRVSFSCVMFVLFGDISKILSYVPRQRRVHPIYPWPI